MKRIRGLKVANPLLCSLLAIACVGKVIADDDIKLPQTVPAEVIGGRFICFSDPSFPSANLSFFGTGLINSFNLPLPTAAATACDATAEETAVRAQSLGCAVGSVETQFNATSFNFVCDGSRDEMVNVIAELRRLNFTQ